MSKGPPEDERTRLLRRLRGRKFDRIRYSAQDALAIRTRGAAPLPQDVQASIRRKGTCRWFPVRGGAYVVRWPRERDEAAPEGGWVEQGAWDHEHCSACHGKIEPGDTFWQTARGSCFWLCPYCYRRPRTFRRP